MIWTIAKKELRGYFNSAVALIFLGAFLAGVLYTFFWHEKFFARGLADLRPLFEWMPITLAVLVSALSMRIWAEEKNTGTLEVLLTLPVARWRLVAGKFVGGMLLISVALALTLGIPFTVARMGDLDMGPVIGGYLAALLLSAAYLVIGMCVSAATNNQLVAFIGTTIAFGLLAGVGKLGATGQLLSTSTRFESVARGVLDLRDLAFYAGIVVVGFAINVLILGSVSWGRGKRARERRMANITSVVLIAANAIILVLWLSPVRRARIDLTQDGAYSLSSATRNIIGNLDQTLLIRGYFSEKSHPDVEPLVPQLRDLLDEYRVAGGGKVKVEIIDPTEDDEAKRDAKERFDIAPQPIENVTSSQRAVVNAYFAIAIQYGDQHEVLGLFDLIQVRQLGTDKPDIKLRNSEYQITKSIKKVVSSFQSIDSLFASVPGKVKVTTYITPDSLPDNLKEAPAKLKKILDELGKDAGGKLEVASVAPKSEPEMIELYRKYGLRPFTDLVAGKTYYFQILIEIGQRIVRIQPPETLGDAALKTAIVDGLKRGAPGFTRVVGMWTPPAPMPMPDQMGMGMPPQRMPPPQQFQRLKQQLAGNYEVRDVQLEARIPDDVDVLLLCGPANLDAKSVETIDQFVMRGGALVVLAGRFRLAPAEGIAIERVTTGLEKLFEAWGISIDDKLVLDSKSDTFPVPRARDVGGGMMIREFQQVAYPFFVKVDGERLASSIITGGIPGSIVHFGAPITAKDKVGEDSRVVEHLLSSSSDSWLSNSLSVDLDPDRGFPPPVDGKRDAHALAVSIVGGFASGVAKKEAGSGDAGPKGQLAEHSPPDARIVVFGSSVFVSDALLNHAEQFQQGLALSNVQLVHNAVDWAFADTDLLAIRAQGTGSHALTIDADQHEKWRIINAIIALLLLAGVITFAQVRRRAVTPVIGQRREV